MDYGQQMWDWAYALWQWAIPNGLLDLLKAAAAPIVAWAALRVSRQQVRINATKLRLDMYDRRVKVYGGVKDVLGTFVTNGRLTTADLLSFREQTAEADFLFSDEIQAYLHEMDLKVRRLIIEEEKYRRGAWKSKEIDPQDAYAKVDELHDWLLEQPAAAKLVFKPALSMEIAAERGWFARLWYRFLPMKQKRSRT